ncbi:hypothetical protein B0I37DRAFT_154755 [Chaetomium sp. MPI-CAGE-AT-0009]|nr:hypothetical protein B0I37DRAFT_154755 [Chaetomium sp. MPI-CAGE-AT-0009]
MVGIVQSSDGDVASPRTMARTPIGFLDLPSELRNMIYDLALVREDPIKPWPHSHGQECWKDPSKPWSHFRVQECWTPGLLRANQPIHREASSILYGRNCFNFTNAVTLEAPDQLVSFLKNIGPNNAGYIQHVLIDFPVIYRMEEAIDILANIGTSCVNLSALTTSLSTTNIFEHALVGLSNDVAVEVLKRIDAAFKKFQSLQKITLQAYDDPPGDGFRTVMKGFGWTFDLKGPEDWLGDISGSDDDYWIDNNYEGPDDDYGYDEDDLDPTAAHDVVNDSDI